MSPLVPQGPPSDVSPRTHGRIARTFFLYRMVRHGVVALLALVAIPITAAGGAPWWVPLLCAVLVLLSAWVMWRTWRRWRGAQSAFVD